LFDFVAVGHFSIDRVLLPGNELPLTILGGSVAYSLLTAKRFAVSVSVISKVGYDFLDEYVSYLEQESIDLSGMTTVNTAKTTSYELRYDDDMSHRKLRLLSKTPAITVEDIPESLKAKIIHITPIANEVSYTVIKKLRGRTPYLSIDPQGLVRTFNKSGITTYHGVDRRLFRFFDIYKSTLDEAKAITGLSDLASIIKGIHSLGVRMVIITLGVEGVLISFNQTIHHIPSLEPKRVVDPTGAGDVFAGAFLAEYLSNFDPLWCGCVGSAAASLSVETSGPNFFGSRLMIYQRARLLHGKEIKQLHLS
jgi:sugar/nucleoside kinase (ribokinase family)